MEKKGRGGTFQWEKHLPLTIGVITTFLRGGRVQGCGHVIQEALRSSEKSLHGHDWTLTARVGEKRS